MGHFRSGVQYRTECHRTMVCHLAARPPQGLGTGLLFTDNIDYPLHIEGDCLWFHPEEQEPDLLNWLKQ